MVLIHKSLRKIANELPVLERCGRIALVMFGVVDCRPSVATHSFLADYRFHEDRRSVDRGRLFLRYGLI
jgi:hypothetical protein